MSILEVNTIGILKAVPSVENKSGPKEKRLTVQNVKLTEFVMNRLEVSVPNIRKLAFTTERIENDLS